MSPAPILRYRPINPRSTSDLKELTTQRKICGWNYDNIDTYMSAIQSNEMHYFLFSLTSGDAQAGDGEGGEEKERIIGSGGLDLNPLPPTTDQNNPHNPSHQSTFCVMGMFLYPEYRGNHHFRNMAHLLIEYGFNVLNRDHAILMTSASNPITNTVFKKFGFVEVYREGKPEWHERDAVGIHYELSRRSWRELCGGFSGSGS